jgi:multicomponent Na+:H+ antiporter subunit F
VIGDVFFYVGIGWLTLLLGVCVVRITRAETLAQRLLGLDLLVLVLIGLLALTAGNDGRSYALDAALALALLSFVATLAAARYLGDRRPLG